DQHRVPLLVRIAILLRLDESPPDLLVRRARLVDLGGPVEARDPALGQDAGLAELGLAQVHGHLGAVPEHGVGLALAPLPQAGVLVVVHHRAAPWADLGEAVRLHGADQADVGGKRGVDVLVQDLRDLGQGRSPRQARAAVAWARSRLLGAWSPASQR